MQEFSLPIINRLGLHARAASRFVAESGRFASRVRVRKDGDWVDGKSIMAVKMLAAGTGAVLEAQTEGEDEVAAREALVALVNDYFGEGG